MFNLSRSIPIRLILVGLLAVLFVGALNLAVHAQPAAAPLVPDITGSIELTATDDVDVTQRGDHDTSYPSSYLVLSKDGAGNYDNNFVLFDLSVLPANATINSAELHLNVSIFNGAPLDVELARANGAWDEATITWNNQPTVTLGGPVTTISATGDLSWSITSIVQAWQNGTLPNYGVALRGTNSNGAAVIADSKETGVAPKLVINYTIPAPAGARPDLGDAPDSSNPLGITNTAYPGIPGNFPTVWAGTPITQPAGPRHANQTGEGILGDFLSRENEAYTGPDNDGVNNILDGGTDNANNDRGDDGWRNRNANFDNCEQTTLIVRVSKAPTATLHKMYLNVWFDGNHDGDWNDFAPCLPQGEELHIPSTEWIVQDYIVDMTGIPAGGSVDIPINTETVLNTSPNKAHWIRFTLSETRTVQSTAGRADGRGPNPATSSYQYGETEDYLQRPQPPGEPGSLEIHKTVGSNGFPVEWLDFVTYKVNLRHVGGSQPIPAELRDELPYPLIVYPSIDSSGVHYVTVDSQGTASPLQAKLDLIPSQGGNPPQQVVGWRGTLDPNSAITLTFKVRVLSLCASDQQTQTLHNIAQARAITSSVVITAHVAFDAKCLGYTGDDIDAHWVNPVSHTQTITDILQWIDYHGGQGNSSEETEAKQGETEARTEAWILNPTPISITLLISRSITTSVPGWNIFTPHLDKVTLVPSQTQLLDYGVDFTDLVTDELSLPDSFTAVQQLNFCILPDPAAAQCPSAGLFPQLQGHSTPLTITIKPHDLGDAPDSSNHAGAAMTAYPGVPANYPTVYDPALGLPIGPLHVHPRPFHLGPNVSREAEADGGPDEDPLNNIEPTANDANNDRFDDGINPDAWSLTNCQTQTIPVRVFISPQAVNWFQQQNQPAYLNLWLDGNRDGDWADGFTCPPDQAGVEHIVIDRAINVAALGAGLHTINVTTGLIPWPADLAQQPVWVRVTLSERPSNKTLNFGGINYGDGRGYAVPFHTGETEDYYARPEGASGAGPDMGVETEAIATEAFVQQPGGSITVTDRVRFKIDYANVGSRPASGAVLTVAVPAQLQGAPPTVLQAPGIPPTDITHDNAHLYFLLPYLEQDNVQQIILGWEKNVSGGIRLPYTLTARVDVNGDLDLSNNQATTTVTPTQPAPIIGILIGLLTEPWGAADTTCNTTVNFSGIGTPGETIDVLLDGQPAGNALIDPNGLFTFQLSNLSTGRHRVQARYANGTTASLNIVSPRDVASGLPTGLIQVNPALPIDPSSLTFTDSQGHISHPPTLGYSFGATQTGAFLKNGETYEVGIDSCSAEPNQHMNLFLENTLISGLRDDDGDGRYTGSFTYNPIVLASPTAANNTLRLAVTNGGIEQNFSLNVQPLIVGLVRDAVTLQPIANTDVTALGAQPVVGSAAIFNAWPNAALGQPNPQTTDGSGAYSFNTPGSLNRVDVGRSGYQAYRSFDIAATTGSLAQDINLTPEITGTATYTVYLTDQGFDPAVVKAAPGSIIAWVNVDLAEHTTTGDSWDSGVLGAGQVYRFKLNAPGTYTYIDQENPLESALIVVEGNRVYLPLIRR